MQQTPDSAESGHSPSDSNASASLDTAGPQSNSGEALFVRLTELVEKASELCGAMETKRASVEAVLERIQEIRNEANNSLQSIRSAKGNIESIATQVDLQKNEIAAAQAASDSVKKQVDANLANAQKLATTAEQSRDRATLAADAITQLAATLAANKTLTDENISGIKVAAGEAKQAVARLVEHVATAKTADERVASLNKELADFSERCQSQLQAIEGLLPGATSAGLAHAFDERRKTFKKPAMIWQVTYILSVLAIAVLAGTGLFHTFVSGVPASWDELFRLWLSRLPVVGALLWLALHASREAALSNRLEEDYGYKSAIAASFQGFHKQMTDLTTLQSGSPVSDLCANTLQALANPPGRIYEKYKLIVTPADQLSKLVDSLGDGIKNATAVVASKEKPK